MINKTKITEICLTKPDRKGRAISILGQIYLEKLEWFHIVNVALIKFFFRLLTWQYLYLALASAIDEFWIFESWYLWWVYSIWFYHLTITINMSYFSNISTTGYWVVKSYLLSSIKFRLIHFKRVTKLLFILSIKNTTMVAKQFWNNCFEDYLLSYNCLYNSFWLDNTRNCIATISKSMG